MAINHRSISDNEYGILEGSNYDLALELAEITGDDN